VAVPDPQHALIGKAAAAVSGWQESLVGRVRDLVSGSTLAQHRKNKPKPIPPPCGYRSMPATSRWPDVLRNKAKSGTATPTFAV
jgi:hypothetical protein